MAAPIPTVKVEAMDSRINMEDTPSPSDVGMEDADLVEEEEDLDFSRAQQPLWLSKLPKYLWETLAKISDNDEIELGTIRVEGTLENPTRVSLKLHDAVFCKEMEKEYILKKNTGPQRRLHRPGQVMMFSEKNKPGFKQRANVWDNIDEDGNPGQGRSQLYEAKLKEERRKESKDQEKQKYTPYVRRPIPKITALEGSVQQEFETVPVVNAEYERFEKIRTDRALRILKGDAIQIVEPNVQLHYGSIISQTERQNIGRQARNKRQEAKDNRAARMDMESLLRALFEEFKQHRYWGLRDLKQRLRQPEQFVREGLERIAVMHKAGDFNGKWELKPENRATDHQGVDTVAPEAIDVSDVDMDDEEFEDVPA